jgi:hypothetical protein
MCIIITPASSSASTVGGIDTNSIYMFVQQHMT